MAEKTPTIPPEFGENPSLSAEELELLRAKNGLALEPGENAEVMDIATLTARLMEKNLNGTQIAIEGAEVDEIAGTESEPPSMSAERLKMTNRPPDPDIYKDVARSILKPENDETPPTKKVAYRVEEDKE